MANSKDDMKTALGIQESQPTLWFETLYANSSKDGDGVPWAEMDTHPSFKSWLVQHPLDGRGKSALVVGCGVGDDAIALEALGFDVTAFDVSASAIDYCKERFPQSKVTFLQADLLEDQPQWQRGFDFVLEIFTVQALPPMYERELISGIAGFVAPDGQLLVIAETSRTPRSYENGPPWLLTYQHVDAFASHGLVVEGRLVEASDFEGADELLTTVFRRPAE